jgi:NADH-quinone oxidoreductase subunit G
MARPEPKLITFEIDGREVQAPEGMMLVDAAKQGDVEIPYFCYESKLGQPVGACRMCLVEIEGMPKLQTSCSTPVKEGMVVITTSDRVKTAQNAIVEFLLVNHPLDCPVCDKGGECPLQDISYGWGAGRSRVVEPKRHFEKPLEISPLVAIDRERCILCYRCVRFSQEIAEDYQLVFLERGDHTFVGTHDGHPYVAPFSGNIVELCPVGALTSTAYRFRARPWDIEDAGSVCLLCPSQCNVKFTTRDDTKVMRVLARDHKEVDDGWLCDKGRYGYQAIHAPERITAPMARDGGALREVSWERALSDAAGALKRAGSGAAAIVGGEATNEEGFLIQRLFREALGSANIDSRSNGLLDPEQARALARPDFAAKVPDIDYAESILVLDTSLVDESPILDLRVRKALRRNRAKLVVATSRPGTLDPNATAVLRFAPGATEAALGGLAAVLSGGPDADIDELARRSGTSSEALRDAAAALSGSGPTVILWGERLSHGDRGHHTVSALLALARRCGIDTTDEAGLIEVPNGTNSRGLREVGCLPNFGPGLSEPAATGRGAAQIAANGDASAILLFQADPIRTHPDPQAWERALDSAAGVIAFADFLTPALEEYATVVFPAESYAEKEGTVTHPDGRIQRVRQGIAHPGEVRSGWAVLAELSARLDKPLETPTVPGIFGEMVEAVSFYGGLTLDEIGGRGIRWQEREQATTLESVPLPDTQLETPPELPQQGLRLGTVPSLWSGRETQHAQVLRFLRPEQTLEISLEDAERLGLRSGDRVSVSVDGRSVSARTRVHDPVPPGSVFLVEGTETDNATALMNGLPRVVEVTKA